MYITPDSDMAIIRCGGVRFVLNKSDWRNNVWDLIRRVKRMCPLVLAGAPAHHIPGRTPEPQHGHSADGHGFILTWKESGKYAGMPVVGQKKGAVETKQSATAPGTVIWKDDHEVPALPRDRNRGCADSSGSILRNSGVEER